MNKFFFICLLSASSLFSQNNWSSNTSPSYDELIGYLKGVSETHGFIELYNMGKSDYGLPIYLCIVNGAQDSLQTFKKARKETTILFNNAIHPGEPDGINACLIWLEELIADRQLLESMPIVAFVPAYNVGGMLNRSSTSRANQNGPEFYGFRGNAQNLDLNRDFIKMDAKNSFVFTKLFHALNPDVFVDNHVSNGADYQYTLTYISTLNGRLSESLEKLKNESLIPELSKGLSEGYSLDLFPYVDLKGKTPDDGMQSFNDLPRYSMGYTNLFQTLSFTVETHMLKPFPERVVATLAFMKELIKWVGRHEGLIEKARGEAILDAKHARFFRYNYVSTSQIDSIFFKGYRHRFPRHEVTRLKRLKYDSDIKFNRYIPYYSQYKAKGKIEVPDSYYVARQERDVIKRLKANKVEMEKIQSDTVMKLGVFEVMDYSPLEKPYEGHFRLNDVKIKRSVREVKLKQGDYHIRANQFASSFIHAVLQPESEDSYLSWNFFDSYLQQKEHFSSYIFIDKIEEILLNDPELNQAYKRRVKDDKSFRESEWKQLYFIYQRSPYYEKSVNILPIYFSH